jgi:hypothetical protein
MLNLSQAKVSIGFSVCKGAKARRGVLDSGCRQGADGASRRLWLTLQLEIDAHDLTSATKWYNLGNTRFTPNRSKHPNHMGGKNERTGPECIE